MIKNLMGKNKTWANITNFKPEDLDILKEEKFRDLDIASVAMPVVRSKAEIYKYYTYIILNVPLLNENKMVRTRRVDLFINENKLITISKKPLRVIEKLYERMEKDDAFREKNLKNLNLFLFQILKFGVREIEEVSGEIGLILNNLNKEMIARGPRHTIEKVSLARRNVIMFLTLLKPMMMVFSRLTKENSFFSNREREHFDSVFDELKVVWDDAEDYKELVAGIALTNESLVSYQINETIRILTIFSVFMLPLTLLASIYGMNIGLPFQDKPVLVFGLIGGVLCVEILIYFYLRRKY